MSLPHRQTGRRGGFESVFSPIALSDNVFNVIVWVALPVSQLPFDTVGHHYTRNALIIDVA